MFSEIPEIIIVSIVNYSMESLPTGVAFTQ